MFTVYSQAAQAAASSVSVKKAYDSQLSRVTILSVMADQLKTGQWCAILSVKGMTCSSCVQSVERACAEVGGVRSVVVCLDREEAVVEVCGPSSISRALCAAVEDAGFETTEKEVRPSTMQSLGSATPSATIGDSRSVGHIGRPYGIFPSKSTSLDGDTHGELRSAVLLVEGMTCQSCVSSVQRVLEVQPGVRGALVSLEKGQATVSYDPEVISQAAFAQLVTDAGFDATVAGEGGECHDCFQQCLLRCVSKPGQSLNL